MSRKIEVVKWHVDVGKKTYVLTERQYRALLEAEDQGRRFIAFEDFTINPAYIRSMERKVRRVDPEYHALPDVEHKFLAEEVRRLPGEQT